MPWRVWAERSAKFPIDKTAHVRYALYTPVMTLLECVLGHWRQSRFEVKRRVRRARDFTCAHYEPPVAHNVPRGPLFCFMYFFSITLYESSQLWCLFLFVLGFLLNYWLLFLFLLLLLRTIVRTPTWTGSVRSGPWRRTRKVLIIKWRDKRKRLLAM